MMGHESRQQLPPLRQQSIDNSESQQRLLGKQRSFQNPSSLGEGSVDVRDPSANVELDEYELQQIYSRPQMNPMHAR